MNSKPSEAKSGPSSDSPAADWGKLLADGLQSGDFQALADCTAHDPHRLLGAQPGEVGAKSGVVIRAWHPEAAKIEYGPEGSDGKVAAGDWAPLDPSPTHGLFGTWVEGASLPFAYKLRFTLHDGTSWERRDPYSFLPTLGDVDLYLHGAGDHYEAYNKFGAQLTDYDGVQGVSFAVWAPSARRVSVIGDFNGWDGRIHPMRSMGSSGVWELFVPGLSAGDRYKYEIATQTGDLRVKADPYAFAFDLRPSTHAKVYDRTTYDWADGDFMEGLAQRDYLTEPMAVYEVHLGSWKRVPEEENRWLTYRELAHDLVPHLKRFGFTHVELLPVAEHPFDGSWGYQVTGYYAPTSRFGTPDDFKYFVDYMHKNGIGVIVDWVPAHFPKDDFALGRFDGTALYEHDDPRLGEHKDWGTLIFNYGRAEVKNFLLSNALYWLDEYHIDGLRVDAVASMLYLDYSREEGEWIPNKFGGRENLEAIDFLRQLNTVVHQEYPGRFTVAEESTSFGGVSRPTYVGGLGFTFKWNMGWMNDTLEYFERDPLYRQHHQGDLTFALIYQYTENFVLPFSHDEVVHGKGSMLDKMPGDSWQKFANLRLLLTYLYAHPGKKLLFQGVEIAQWAEWDHAKSVDWHQGGFDVHANVSRLLEDLGKVYAAEPALWRWDHDEQGFRWIDFHDGANSVLSFIRYAPDGRPLVCAFNFTPVPREDYRIGLPQEGFYKEILNSDAENYGGANVGNYGGVQAEPIPWHGLSHSAKINFPPLGGVIFAPEG